MLFCVKGLSKEANVVFVIYTLGPFWVLWETCKLVKKFIFYWTKEILEILWDIIKDFYSVIGYIILWLEKIFLNIHLFLNTPITKISYFRVPISIRFIFLYEKNFGNEFGNVYPMIGLPTPLLYFLFCITWNYIEMIGIFHTILSGSYRFLLGVVIG